MVLLQHKLSVKLSQRQILTPGLVQMVSVLALNKLELKDMINAEMVENPVLEELEESVPLIDEIGRKEEDRDRPTPASGEEAPITAEKKDPVRRNRFRILLPGLSRSRLPHPRRDGRDRAPVVRKLPLQANQSNRPPRLATRRAEPAPRSPRGRRTDHRQPQRRRLPDRQRRRDAGRSPARASRSRRRRRQKYCQRSPGSGIGPGRSHSPTSTPEDSADAGRHFRRRCRRTDRRRQSSDIPRNSPVPMLFSPRNLWAEVDDLPSASRLDRILFRRAQRKFRSRRRSRARASARALRAPSTKPPSRLPISRKLSK